VKAVFDTNVLIVAFLTEGICAKCLMRGRKRYFYLILSSDIIKETERILRRKFKLSSSEISAVITLLKETASAILQNVDPIKPECRDADDAASEILQNVDPIKPICRDADDDKILACAGQSDTDYIVTGDEDLLVIKRYGRTKVITPRDFETFFND